MPLPKTCFDTSNREVAIRELASDQLVETLRTMRADVDRDSLGEMPIFRALRNEAKRRGINGQTVTRGGWKRSA